MTSFIPFARPDIGQEEIDAVVEAMRSDWLTTGPVTQRFEHAFAETIGGVEAVAVNSATAGLHLAAEAIGIGPGDEVITTTHTFTATAEVVRYLGADPVFVDCDATTLNIDPARIEAAVTPRTKAIIVVHFGGLACDMDPIITIARRHGLQIIEDAAHALPTTYKGSMIGSLDTAATIYSFYATKTLVTGEGGMLVTRDPAIAKRARTMRLHGIDRDVFDRFTSSQSKWRYEIVAPGFKYNMTDVAAAMGLPQLRKMHLLHEKRSALATAYDEAFADLPLQLPAHPQPGDVHAWHLYVVRLRDETPMDRDGFIEGMAARGVGCSVHYIPLHLQPYWRDKYELRPEDFPASTDAFSRAVSIPLFSRMTTGERDTVIESVQSLLGRD